MAERFLSARQARLNPPFSLVNSHLLRIGPQAVQGAKRRSGPLTARTDPGSSRERERGELRAGSPQPDGCTKERFMQPSGSGAAQYDLLTTVSAYRLQCVVWSGSVDQDRMSWST